MIQRQIQLFLHPLGARAIYPRVGYQMWEVGRWQVGIDFILNEYIVFDIKSGRVIPENLNGKFFNSTDLIHQLKRYVYMQHFKLSEFDSPDLPGSGQDMDIEFLQMLDKARDIAGVPFRINAGYRTEAHNKDLIKRGYQASPTSSHLKGLAADIAVSSQTREGIINACIEAGFKRIGIANSFIHVDSDSDKVNPAVWAYKGVDVGFIDGVRAVMK